MSLAPPVHPSPVTSARGLRKLWRVNRDSHQSKVRDNVVTMLGPYYVLSIGTIQIQIRKIGEDLLIIMSDDSPNITFLNQSTSEGVDHHQLVLAASHFFKF